jgi:hypothetical protein
MVDGFPPLLYLPEQWAVHRSLFGFSDYARVDFRVDPTGAPFIIDVNPNPYLTLETEDAAAAAEAGISYQDLIASIVESSLGFSQASAKCTPQLRIAQNARATTPPAGEDGSGSGGRWQFLKSAKWEPTLQASGSLLFGAAMSERDSERTRLLSQSTRGTLERSRDGFYARFVFWVLS